MNKKCILLNGVPATGKSASLRNLDPSKILYCNTDGKSEMDFEMEKSFGKFTTPSDPLQIIASLHAFEESEFEYVVVDTLSEWVDQIEQYYILPSDDSRGDWGKVYAASIKELLNFARLKSSKTWIFISHIEEGGTKNKSAIKGSVGKKGIEALFSTVLETYTYDLAEENVFGSVIGYGFIAKPTLEHRKTSARSPIGMFPGKIQNNDLDLVLRRLAGEKIDWDDKEVLFAKDKQLIEKLNNQ